MGTQVGDKVKLKSGALVGRRGTIVEIDDVNLVVRVSGEDSVVETGRDDVTNLSLAARKAWQSMPDRRVGRPKGTRLCDRVSVTLRIDRDLWQQFRQLEATGEVEDRTATINGWLRDKVEKLKSNGNAS